MNKKLLSIICATIIFTGCSKSPKITNGEEVIASIDGKDFTANELYQTMKDQYGTSILVNMVDKYIAEKEIGDSEDAKVHADSMIEQYKLQYEQYGMDFNEALANAGYANEEAFKEVLMSDYKMSEISKKYLREKITDKEIETYYNDKISEEMNVKHILIIPDVAEGASEDAKKEAETVAYNEAVELIKKLDEGADFETLAKENSDDTASASNGGVINNVTKEGYVTEFYNAAYNLEDGKYTKEPVKSEYGYHIIYRVSKNEKAPLDELKDSIKDSLVDEKLTNDQNLEMKTWGEIRSKYNLNISDTNLKNTYNTTITNLK
ncbi:MAG: peptidylprolyl isomerase [Bacilli bacterium]|nr:peptidylprolyl isomerase [Bacilli bacterium]